MALSMKFDWAEYRRQKVEQRKAREIERAAKRLAISRVVIHALPPQTITAYFCGDPPPGRSALDKMRAHQ